MSDSFPEQLAALCQKARRETLSDSLITFGEVVCGVRGYPVCNGFVIHSGAPESAIVSGNGTVLDPAELLDWPDPVLNHLGLRMGQAAAAGPDRFRASLAILAVRLGILSRIMDMAYGHLKDRVSFGQKTLSHQLVKATFAEVHGAVVTLTEQMRLRAEESLSAGLGEDHWVVTEMTGKAEKLMGGHGYLLTGTHPLGYLSMLLFSVYGNGSC